MVLPTRLLLSLLFYSAAPQVIAQTQVQWYTSLGEFTLEVREDLVPITGGNFIGLVESKFYDGIIFHRVIDNFIIQGGDPTGTGSGGSGVIIPDEFTDSLSNLARTISMANSGPNTGTSQFFINLVNNTFLDYDKPPLTSAHPIFGEVIDGWSTVLAIADVPVNISDRPLTDVVMDSLRIINMASSINSLAANIRGYSLRPNPVDASSWLEITLDVPEQLSLSVIDVAGKTVGDRVSFSAARGQNRLELTGLGLSGLPPASYFLFIAGERGDVRAIPFVR
ncbi:MAG: hypothetical protein GC205_10360 [Bacteroidetes bacterium]|nr:hypothetical protein [Bacteroidota bacterium]